MDGNGRWALGRNQLRSAGHLEGLKTAKRIVQAAGAMGVSYLTLYVFSTENWKRSVEEVGFIMGLVKQYLLGELNFFKQNRIRIRYAGDHRALPADIEADIRKACADTRDFEGLQVVLALNYGGRDEILRAFKRFLAQVSSDRSAGLTEAEFRAYLDNPDIPDPDLIIRTAGEMRISNFLLWEGAYAEYYSSPKLWPDFTEEDLKTAIAQYQNRDRRYGGGT
jgi:undecaprenyl diphosphate synthase